MKLGKLWKISGAAALVGLVGIASACASPAVSAPVPAPKVAQNLILDANTTTGSGGTLKADAVCVLGSQFKRGQQVVWRIKVIDPATGQPLDDKALQSVKIALPDGQTFDAKYGGHPAKTPTDSFWATSWVVPQDYPTGSLPYVVNAKSADGRTGKFTEFNVAPSLLTVVQ